MQSAVSMRWQAAHGVGKRIRGLRGGERAPNEHTIWKNSSARKTDCYVRHATPTLGNVWCFKYSAAGAVRTIGAMAVARPCMESAYSSSFARMGLKGERRHARVGRLRPDDVGATSLSSIFHEAQKGYEGYPVRPVGVRGGCAGYTPPGADAARQRNDAHPAPSAPRWRPLHVESFGPMALLRPHGARFSIRAAVCEIWWQRAPSASPNLVRSIQTAWKLQMAA